MNNIVQKLQKFSELITYRPLVDNRFAFCDPAHPENMKIAEDWFNRELSFLTKRDKEDLYMVWQYVCEHGNTKMIFNAIKVLQEKYDK